MAKKAVSSIDIIDTVFTYGLVEWAKATLDQSVTFSYAELARLLAHVRQAEGFRASDAIFAPVAVDTMSDPQRRFIEALDRMGITVERVDYRHTYVSVPRTPGADRAERSVTSLTPYMAYLLGMLAGREAPEVLIVTGSFDLHGTLLDFVERRNGRATIAYFKRFLDQRWIQNGLLEDGFPIKFVDLESQSEALLGINIAAHFTTPNMRKGGLSAF